MALLEQRALEFQIARLHASDESREQTVIVSSRLARARETVASLERQQQQLTIRAPFSGRIVDLDPDISDGLWLDNKQPLARLVSDQKARVKGLITDADVARVIRGAHATFVADDAAKPKHPAIVESIAQSSDGRLSEPVLADLYGGEVAASDEGGELVTSSGWFEVRLTSQHPAPPQLIRGVIHIDAEGVSPFMLAWRRIAQVLVREQGF
jgi:putative peptide zinc metalloprotease protein